MSARTTGHVDMPWHPAAELLPLMGDEELAQLADDIRAHGLRTPIVLLAGVEPRFEYVTSLEIGDPFLYVASLNLHRRHLSESQRAMIGARIKAHLAAEAKERQREGGRLGGESDAKGSANLREASAKAAVDAAAAVNVSPRSVESAARVLAKGTPELVQAVERGDVAVSAAAEVARLPVAEQVAVVEQGPRAVASAAKHAREARKAQPEIEAEDADDEALLDPERAPASEPEVYVFNGPIAAPEPERPLDYGRLAPAEMEGLSREGAFIELARTFRERLAALIAKHPIESLAPPRRERVYGELHRTLIDVAKALPESEQKAPASRWNPVVVSGGKS